MRKVFLLLFFSAFIVSGWKSHAAEGENDVPMDCRNDSVPPSVPIKRLFSLKIGTSATITGECEGNILPLKILTAYDLLKATADPHRAGGGGGRARR